MCARAPTQPVGLDLDARTPHPAHHGHGATPSTDVPNSEHLRFRVIGRLSGAHARPGVAQWVPIDRGRKVVSSDGSCARLRGSSKMTGRPNLFQIGRPTRASSWSAHSVPARSRSPTLVPAQVCDRARGVWRPLASLDYDRSPASPPVQPGPQPGPARSSPSPSQVQPGLQPGPQAIPTAPSRMHPSRMHVHSFVRCSFIQFACSSPIRIQH
jgi:hypothetical protein